MSEITMPRLSDSMEEGTIVKWLAEGGETLALDQELVEIETDKATMTVASEVEGVLEIVAAEGATVPVGEVIARAGAERSGAAAGADGRILTATPLARRAARAHGVQLDRLRGSGPRGRITRADVFAAVGKPAPVPVAPQPRPAAPASGQVKGQVKELSRVQRLIAGRMTEARTTIPEFEVETEVSMDEAVRLRHGLRGVADDEAVPSVNDLLVKAVALALRRHPRINASFSEDHLQLHSAVNIGVAVAGDDALVVPTVRDADSRSLGSIAAETRRLAQRVRAGTVSADELTGGTFTVSNLGMYGMTAIRPIINAPQVGILGAGAIREVPARRDSEIVWRKVMTLTLSCDHRAVYGADAARFLAEVRRLLESPLLLAL